MHDMLSCVPVFATPYASDDQQVIQLCANAYLHAVKARIEKRTGVALDFLSPTIAGAPVRAWRPEAGMALEALQKGRHSEAILHIALAYAGMGYGVDINASLPDKSRLFFCGYAFYLKGDIRVTSTGSGRICISCNGASFADWQYSEKGLEIANLNNSPFEWMPVPAPWREQEYLVPSSIQLSNDRYIAPEETASLEKADYEDDYAGIKSGRRFISHYAPVFSDWVHRLSAGYLLCDSPSGFFHSASSITQPGFVSISKIATEEMAGELLVHEHAHQHFFLLHSILPLTNNLDDKLYYSPLKKAQRDIYRLLLATHATVNMLLYYAEAYAHGADYAQLEKMTHFHMQCLDQVREIITLSPGLTEAGRRFFDAMMQKIDETNFSWLHQDA